MPAPIIRPEIFIGSELSKEVDRFSLKKLFEFLFETFFQMIFKTRAIKQRYVQYAKKFPRSGEMKRVVKIENAADPMIKIHSFIFRAS